MCFFSCYFRANHGVLTARMGYGSAWHEGGNKFILNELVGLVWPFGDTVAARISAALVVCGFLILC